MSKIEVHTTRQEPLAMYFREAWASGTTDEGVEFDFARTIGGATLVLEVGTFAGGDRIVETLTVNDLVSAWLSGIKQRED